MNGGGRWRAWLARKWRCGDGGIGDIKNRGIAGRASRRRLSVAGMKGDE